MNGIIKIDCVELVYFQMPKEDKYHSVVLHCLEKDGWTIIKEQEYISIGTYDNTNRRLYIDIKAERDGKQQILLEIKGLETSPVHKLMQLLGQYLIYQIALDYLKIDIALYVAIPESAYQGIMQHILGQETLKRYSIPLLIFDPFQKEIVRWIPQP